MWIVSKDRSDVWTGAEVPLGNGGGIGCHEWLNLDTGAALLLYPTGKRSQGGAFLLYYLRAGTELVVDITEKFFSAEMNVYPRNKSDGWEAPKARCISFVTNAIGAKDALRL